MHLFTYIFSNIIILYIFTQTVMDNSASKYESERTLVVVFTDNYFLHMNGCCIINLKREAKSMMIYTRISKKAMHLLVR